MATKTFTIGTFNAENLFTRFNFRGKKTKKKDARGRLIYEPFSPQELFNAVKGGFIIDRKVFVRYLETYRKLTASALKGIRADIVGLQEIENLDTLKTFNSRYLKSKRFSYQYLIDGNDPRFIDVALLSRFPVDHLRTHQFTKKGRSRVFSRDCLEAHLTVHGKPLAVFVNHFKSMMGGRGRTKKRRQKQSAELLAILTDRFGAKFGDADFVVLGDLNDYMEPGKESQSGIRDLLQSPEMENVIDRLPVEQRWTHFYNGDKSYNQLDYVLISRSLAKKNPTVLPVIERRGQPTRVNLPGQPKKVATFFPGVTRTKKASDHCPAAITLKL